MTADGASRRPARASRASDLDLRPNTSQAPAPTGTHARVRRAFPASSASTIQQSKRYWSRHQNPLRT